MRKLTLYVPTRDNDRLTASQLNALTASGWRPSDHVRRVREDLAASGFEGWTEYEARGVWYTDTEAVRVFEVLSDAVDARETLAGIARVALADQDSILLTSETLHVDFLVPTESATRAVEDFPGALAGRL